MPKQTEVMKDETTKLGDMVPVKKDSLAKDTISAIPVPDIKLPKPKIEGGDPKRPY